MRGSTAMSLRQKTRTAPNRQASFNVDHCQFLAVLEHRVAAVAILVELRSGRLDLLGTFTSGGFRELDAELDHLLGALFPRLLGALAGVLFPALGDAQLRDGGDIV